ncbi:hypothetical protein CHUAL_007772 [Chamberlinius hualienensis]
MADFNLFIPYLSLIFISSLPLFLTQVNQSPIKFKRDLNLFQDWFSQGKNNKGYAKLEWRHCGSKNDDIILKNIKLNPNPIQVPGKVFVSFNMEVKENQTAPIKLRVDMKKKVPVLFGISTWIPVPCYPNGLGSCSIDDICDTAKLNLLSCPMAFLAQNISCQCPIPQGNYSLPPMEQEVPLPPPDLDPLLMEGEFQIKFSLYKTYKRLTCYETTANINLN